VLGTQGDLLEQTPGGRVRPTGEKFFERLQSRVNACQRSYYKRLKELKDLRSKPIADAPPVPVSAPQPIETHPPTGKLASFRESARSTSRPPNPPQAQPSRPVSNPSSGAQRAARNLQARGCQRGLIEIGTKGRAVSSVPACKFHGRMEYQLRNRQQGS
jgi:hypothetical protein